LWTVSGAGVGFGVGLWAGLTPFDDAVNSDRKVWTSAVVGAGIGAVAGYLIGRARDNHDRAPSATTAALTWRRETLDRRLLERLARSITFSKATPAAASISALTYDRERSLKGELEVSAWMTIRTGQLDGF
jgi:hypothetical protein